MNPSDYKYDIKPDTGTICQDIELYLTGMGGQNFQRWVTLEADYIEVEHPGSGLIDVYYELSNLKSVLWENFAELEYEEDQILDHLKLLIHKYKVRNIVKKESIK